MTREEKNARQRAKYAANPEPQKAASRAFRLANAEAVREADRIRGSTEERRAARKKWYSENSESQKERSRKTRRSAREKDLEAVRATQNARRAAQRATPQGHLRDNLRSRIWQALKRCTKSAGTLELLDMDVHEYRIYLQGQFKLGMTWENYGDVWHIDHIRPCATFDLRDPAQQRECFNWSNTQPLFAIENLQKGSHPNF